MRPSAVGVENAAFFIVDQSVDHRLTRGRRGTESSHFQFEVSGFRSCIAIPRCQPSQKRLACRQLGSCSVSSKPQIFVGWLLLVWLKSGMAKLAVFVLVLLKIEANSAVYGVSVVHGAAELLFCYSRHFVGYELVQRRDQERGGAFSRHRMRGLPAAFRSAASFLPDELSGVVQLGRGASPPPAQIRVIGQPGDEAPRRGGCVDFTTIASSSRLFPSSSSDSCCLQEPHHGSSLKSILVRDSMSFDRSFLALSSRPGPNITPNRPV
jgi:hypothetical protein